MSWTNQGSLPLVPGETYRMVMITRAPFNDASKLAIRVQFEGHAVRKGYVVKGFDYLPPMFSSHSNELAPWTAIMLFTVDPVGASQAGMDPRALIALAGLVLAIALSFTLVETRIERLVRTTGETVSEVVKPVFNPGFLILAFGAVALITMGRKAA